jgi:hypothetical protein
MELPKSFSGYSPPITIELQIGSNHFNVASMSSEGIALRDATPLGPTSGVIRMTVDKHLTVYHVELPQGIDPARDEQVYRVIESSDVSAVA